MSERVAEEVMRTGSFSGTPSDRKVAIDVTIVPTLIH